jgi:hypothetical protein
MKVDRRDAPLLGEEIRCGSGVVASPKTGNELGGKSTSEALKIGSYTHYSYAGPCSAIQDGSNPYLKGAVVL